MRKLEHIIFDFDGVIADTFDMSTALCKEHDKTMTEEDFLAHHDGNVFEEPKIKFHPNTVHLFYSEYRNKINSSHIEASVEPIKRLGHLYNLHIISSNSEVPIREVLADAKILDLFSMILGQETHKSKIEKFKILIRDRGILSENTIFITDTLGDIKEAHEVGIDVIAETFGFHNRERLLQGTPFKIVDTWNEIEKEIELLDI